MMANQLRPILPAFPRTDQSDADQPSSSQPAALVPKRRIISQACEPCRKRKERCDGERPTCATCIRRGLECTYASSRTSAANVPALKREYENLQNENHQLRELYKILRNLPETEAHSLLSHIRIAEDPISVLNFARQTVFPQHEPSPSSGPSSLPGNPRVERLNLEALSESPIKVRALPWTQVAGDGLVSDLITSFFVWDDAFFYSFIDRDVFLEDMQAGKPSEAKHCSRFLVNAICASRCFTSIKAKKVGIASRKDVAMEFLDEAKRSLDRENGRASIPTVQGLALLFTLSAYRGSDRAGMMYRYAAYEMLHRLNLEKKFGHIKQDPLKSRQKLAIAKAVWGLFCFENLVAYVYLEQSMLHPPKIPKSFATFTCESQAPATETNVDLFGNPYTKDSRPPPFVPGAFHAICDLSQFLYKSMAWNADVSDIGSDNDLQQRTKLHAEVLEWHSSLPKRLKVEQNLTPQTCFLRIYTDEVLISILRPLHRDTIFHDQRTVKEMLISCTARDTQVMEEYVKAFSLNEYSCMALCGLYNTVLTITPFLEDVACHQIFARACRILRWVASDFPISRYILQGIKAMAWSLQVPIPHEAVSFLRDLGTGKEDLQDIPLSFALPSHDSMKKLLSEGENSGDVGVEMGVLLSKWSTLSIDEL